MVWIAQQNFPVQRLSFLAVARLMQRECAREIGCMVCHGVDKKRRAAQPERRSRRGVSWCKSDFYLELLTTEERKNLLGSRVGLRERRHTGLQ